MGSAKWASQATWYVDPANGSDEAKGDTTLVPIKTRGEFYRRMSGAVLTQVVTVNILSSLNAGDTFKSKIISGPTYYVKFVGTPTVLFTGTITAIVSRAGSAGTHTSMTIDGTGFTSWTASGLVGQVVQWTDGSSYKEGIVVKDEGSKTAWVSLPVNRSGSEQTFINGTTVSIVDYPSLGTDDVVDSVNQIWLLNLKISGGKFWIYSSGNVILQNVIGDLNAYASHLAALNCRTAVVATQSFLLIGSTADVVGGYHRLIPTENSAIVVNQCCTAYGIQVETGSSLTGRHGPQVADLEFCVTQTNIPAIYPVFSNSSVTCSGYVYGTSAGTYGIQFDSENCTVVFAKQPTWTGTNADLIKGAPVASTGTISGLAAAKFSDAANNRAIGTAGP